LTIVFIGKDYFCKKRKNSTLQHPSICHNQ
jgi:hypothetical protein